MQNNSSAGQIEGRWHATHFAEPAVMYCPLKRAASHLVHHERVLWNILLSVVIRTEQVDCLGRTRRPVARLVAVRCSAVTGNAADDARRSRTKCTQAVTA